MDSRPRLQPPPNVMIMIDSDEYRKPHLVPNTERVVHDLQAMGAKREFFVIQGHPDQWDEPRMAEFGKMIDYLTSQGVIFATPYRVLPVQAGSSRSPVASSGRGRYPAGGQLGSSV